MSRFWGVQTRVTVELCIPPEEAARRLRALEVSAWSDRQRKDLRIRRSLYLAVEEDTSAPASDEKIVWRFRNAGRWVFEGKTKRTEKGCRVQGMLEYECREASIVLLCAQIVWMCAALLAVGLCMFTFVLTPEFAVPALTCMPFAFVIAVWLAAVYSVRADRRAFEAFLHLAFEGAIMELTLSPLRFL